MRDLEHTRLPRWLLACTGCLMLMTGCQSIRPATVIQRSSSPDVVHAHHQQDPAPQPVNAGKNKKPVPISLDAVLRLAQDQNGQVRIARIRLESISTDHYWASKPWMPDLSVGFSAYRHEGGIQDFQGNLVRSSYGAALAGMQLTGKYDWKEVLFRRLEVERRVWQQKGDLSKLTSENLLDATSTYMGLLAARSGIAVSIETEVRLRDLLEQSKRLAKIDSGLMVEVSRIEAELMAQSVLTTKLREASKSAAAKLAYLLGLDPCCDFMVADKQLLPISIIDAKQPAPKLVAQAMSRGPGVRELDGLLQAVEAARQTNYGLSHWMPSVEVNLLEGGFGAAPGRQQYDWANRFDLAVHMRWNLNQFLASKQRRRQADLNIQQVQVSYEDLRSKLTLGVQEALDAIHSGLEQFELAEKHIRFAEESFKLSDQRLKQNVKGRSASEVLLALRTLGGARLEYIQAVRDFNRAQLRLFVLVGASESPEEGYPIMRHQRHPLRTPRHLPPVVPAR
ncbi:MAG: TolC family protein [Planctomycetes bacterium]|nr:TolC family protein [Planctomycetota bacterium]